MKLTIAHLYPDLLNIYGDRGNIICLKNRCLWRGIDVQVVNVSINYNLKSNIFDLFFGGGGQDRQQLIAAKDLQKKKKVLIKEADRGAPMLAICGTYQLFGHYFKCQDGTKIPGISIFNAYTISSHERKTGNIIVKLNRLITESLPQQIVRGKLNHSVASNLIGFENHWGNTFLNPMSIPPRRWYDLDTLGKKIFPLGKVIKGFGNNGKDKTEGAVYKNVFGTYLHGPVLAKNPHFADLLIKLALEVKYKRKIDLKLLDDNLEWQAHNSKVS